MEWRLVSHLERKKIRTGDSFFKNTSEIMPPFAVEETDGAVWLVRPAGDEERMLCVCYLSPDDLAESETWERLIKTADIALVDLARFSRNHPQIAPGIFLRAAGLSADYKNISEWRELGEFDDLTVELARQFDFPVSVLRLFNRLDKEQRRTWYDLWTVHNFKKNIIKEIIIDIYDLSENDRSEALSASLAIGEKYQAKSGVFPWEDVRSLVRRIRRPAIEETLQKIKDVKKKLNLPPGVSLELPPDLETRKIVLKLEFSAPDRLRSQIQSMSSPETLVLIANIMELI